MGHGHVRGAGRQVSPTGTVELATPALPGAPAFSGPAIGRKQLNFLSHPLSHSSVAIRRLGESVRMNQ
jgi:hypothetical protein